MKASEYIQYDALGLAELVRKGEVTADELLDTALAIAAKVEPQIGALCHIEEEVARRHIRDGLPQGPFTGVPFVLKDIKADIADIPMSFGSRFFAGTKSGFDSELVKRYRRGGLNLFGRSTTSELALYLATESRDVYGYDTANPWNLSYSPGGSSGGAAAAVAAGILPMAHATDGGGSIRGPAACCGLVGLKPTRALIPAGPVIGEMWGGMLSDGVVSRTVRDTAAALDVTQGPAPGDPYCAPPVAGRFVDAIREAPPRLRIAYVKDMLGRPVTPDVAEALEKTARLCASLGHEVTEAAPQGLDVPLLASAFTTVMVLSTAMMVEDQAKILGRAPGVNDLEAPTLRLLALARQLGPTDYVRALTTLHRISRQITAFFADYDMLLTPMSAQPSMPLGHVRAHPPVWTKELLDQPTGVSYPTLANITGQPGISVPLFWSSENMPIGSHFIARFGEDALLLRLAAQLEAAEPWFDKLPEMTKAL